MVFQPGERVYVLAQVQHHYHPTREEAMQSVGLQLEDGQGIATNPRNLVRVPPPPQVPMVVLAGVVQPDPAHAPAEAAKAAAAERAQAEAKATAITRRKAAHKATAASDG